MSEAVKRIVIVGGGSAGWMTAAALARALPRDREIQLIDDGVVDDSGCLVPFDSTLPSFLAFNRSLGLDEDRLMAATDATFKLGTRFSDWTRRDAAYVHPFSDFGAVVDGVAFHHLWLKLRQAGQVEPFEDFALAAVCARLGRFARPSDDPRSVTSTMAYGLHLDVTAYAAVVRAVAERAGVRRIDGRIGGIERLADGQGIATVTLEDGRRFDADLFIDCTGTEARLMTVLATTWDDWSAWLPVDRVTSSRTDAPAASLLTEAAATRVGWRLTVPLQNGNGRAEFTASRFQSANDGTTRAFASGRRTPWRGNVTAIGLSTTCLEPLEGTGLHLVQSGISKLLTLFPTSGGTDVSAREYNRLMQAEAERARDIVIAHYRLNRRRGQPLWDAAACAEPPPELAHKIRLFQSRGRIPLSDEETFEEASWISTFMGHHLQPDRYHPLADRFSVTETRDRLDRMRAVMRKAAEAMPAVAASPVRPLESSIRK